MKSVLATKGPRAELAVLINAYDLRRIDDRFPRTRRRVCPEGGLDCNASYCFCEKGVVTDRILWVNATTAYAARLPDSDATVIVMEFSDWLSVGVYYGEILLSEELRVSATGGSITATTITWNGEVAGSGIYNPEGLKGRMYRCPVADEGLWRDGYARPEDIVAYLLAIPRRAIRANPEAIGVPISV